MVKKKKIFVPYGTNRRLECVGRSKVILKAEAGDQIKTIAYVIHGVSESLLGKTDVVKLRIVEFHPEGAESVRKLRRRLYRRQDKWCLVVSHRLRLMRE